MEEYLLAMVRRCYSEGLLKRSSGNVSVYDSESGIMTITPTSIPYNVMEADDIVNITLEGAIVSGKHKPSSEWPMHAAVYRVYPNVKAQIHTHSTYATSFAVNNIDIPVILIEMVPILGGNVRVAHFELPGIEALGLSAVASLEDRNACLLANHGALAVGGSLEQAYINAACLEDVAKTYSLALGNGPISIVSDEHVMAMKKSCKNSVMWARGKEMF